MRMSEDLQKLIEGNKEFQKKYFGTDNKLFDALVVHGQQPKIMVISCCDSRVIPEIIFNCQPGQLFVVRNIANLVPPYKMADDYSSVSAALEFAVTILEVEHIIVLGHSHCGGIQALVNNDEKLQSGIAKWLKIAQPAYEKALREGSLNEATCEKYSLINSLQNLTSFPWINDRVNTGKLTLYAWYFDLATGNIRQYENNN